MRSKVLIMNLKRFFAICISTAICLALLTGCSNKKATVSADLSYMRSDIGTLSVPADVQIVGSGEASHGAAQYQQMKAEVFKTSLDKGTQRKTTENELPSLTQCTA